MKSARPPIEQLFRDLHAEFLRIIQPPGTRKEDRMPWHEFKRRARLEKWDRHSHWKLVEGELKWGPDRIIEVAANLGIRTSITVTGPSTDSLRSRYDWPPAPPERPAEGQGNAPEGGRFDPLGTATPTTVAV